MDTNIKISAVHNIGNIRYDFRARTIHACTTALIISADGTFCEGWLTCAGG